MITPTSHLEEWGDMRLQLMKGMWMNRLLALAQGSTTVVQRELRMQTYAWSWVLVDVSSAALSYWLRDTPPAHQEEASCMG